MITFYNLVFIFFLGSTSGWCVELIYRRLKHKKWINPGFLVGPCLPIYGLGLTILYLICQIPLNFSSQILIKIVLSVITAFLLILLEFVTGLIFTKKLKVKLWDYSNYKYNIMGIICPRFCLIWSLGCFIYVFFVNSHLINLSSLVVNNSQFMFILGIILGFFIVDIFYSFGLVTKLKKWAEKENIIIKYETLKLAIINRAKNLKIKSNFMFPFRSKNGLENELDFYYKNIDDSNKN